MCHLDAHDKLTGVVGAECNSKVSAVRRHCLADWATNFDLESAANENNNYYETKETWTYGYGLLS